MGHVRAAQALLERGEVERARRMVDAAVMTCADSFAAARNIERVAEQAQHAIEAPSLSSAAFWVARSRGSTGSERRRDLAIARRVLERLVNATATLVFVRHDRMFPATTSSTSVPLPRTEFSIGGPTLAAHGDDVIVYDGASWFHVVAGAVHGLEVEIEGREASVHVYGRFALIENRGHATLVDLDTHRTIHRASSNETIFALRDGRLRAVAKDADGVRLLALPEKRMLMHDPLRARGEVAVHVDDVAQRIATYRMALPVGDDSFEHELRILDAADGRVLARTSDPPTNLEGPRFAFHPDGNWLVAQTTETMATFSIGDDRWATVRADAPAIRVGGAHDAAYSDEGHLCAVWRDRPHLVPDDTPDGAYPVCVFEERTKHHRRARIGCVAREPGWVRTSSDAWPVAIQGTSFTRGGDRVAVLENAAGTNPLPGGLVIGPAVPLRVVIADPQSCEIEHRIDLGQIALTNDATLVLSADASSLELMGKRVLVPAGQVLPPPREPLAQALAAFRISWLAQPTPLEVVSSAPATVVVVPGSARPITLRLPPHMPADWDRPQLLASVGLVAIERAEGLVALFDAESGDWAAWLVTGDDENVAAVFADGSYETRGKGGMLRCRIGPILAPLDVCNADGPSSERLAGLLRGGR